ncbi:MAG: hypothetical protein GWN79_25990 [Actinobacteria bacterium]|nr:hypothetical protein [Actinomycetota bacterium]NIS29846.1 hypothetical protein [Actinomycetota bacterium]NIT98673.1 hypothetical protein [Actinomycetota bacterium]NIU22288.1 hypothetical protein [Actinomycetota bacterium]NIU65145.1 hypothetical protein [Actinomycetota bacterium]
MALRRGPLLVVANLGEAPLRVAAGGSEPVFSSGAPPEVGDATVEVAPETTVYLRTAG